MNPCEIRGGVRPPGTLSYFKQRARAVGDPRELVTRRLCDRLRDDVRHRGSGRDCPLALRASDERLEPARATDASEDDPEEVLADRFSWITGARLSPGRRWGRACSRVGINYAVDERAVGAAHEREGGDRDRHVARCPAAARRAHRRCFQLSGHVRTSRRDRLVWIDLRKGP